MFFALSHRRRWAALAKIAAMTTHMQDAQQRLGQQPEWTKSSLSFANGNCVEVAWLASSLCEGGACVEAADLGGGDVGVRNSRDPNGPVLRFTRDEMHAFIGGVKNGEFDRFGG